MTGSDRGSPPPLVLIFAITATGILSNALLSPAIPDILDDLGVPDSRAGLLVSVGAIPGIVVAPIIGVLADRFGRRAVIVPCLVLFGVAGIGAALAPTFWWLVVARLVQGLGSAGLINLAVVLIGDHWTGAERTRLVGRNAAVLTTGLAVLPLASGLLTELVSWRAALALYSIGLLTSVVAWRRLSPLRPERPGSIREQLGGAGVVVRQPVVLATLASGFLTFMIVFGAYLTAFPLHLEREFGLGAGWRGVMLAIPAVPSTMVAFNLHRVRDRLGLRGSLVVAAGCFVAAFSLVGFAGSIALVVPATILYGMGEGALIPTLQDVGISASPDAQRGAVGALWVGSARAGQSVGPLLAAATYGATSTATALVAAGVVALVVLGVQWRGPIDEAAVARAASARR